MGEKIHLTSVDKKIILSIIIVFLLFGTIFLVSVNSLSIDKTESNFIEPNTTEPVVVPRCSTRAIDTKNWTMLHGNNQNHGYSPVTVPRIDSSIWSFQLKDKKGDPVPIYSSPVIVGDQVFVCTHDRQIYSFNRLTGTKIWNQTTDNLATPFSDEIVSTPTVVNDRLYVGSKDSYFYCLNAQTGDLIWYNKTIHEIYSSPKVVGNTVIIGTYNNAPTPPKLFAFNATDGTEFWNFTGPVDLHFHSTPAVDENIIYIGMHGLGADVNPAVYAIYLNNGSIKWTYNTSNGVYSDISIADNKVLLGDLDGKIYALDKTTGDLLWSNSTGNAIYSSPAVDLANNIMYIGSNDGKLYAVRLSDGRILWTYTTHGSSPIRSTPVIAKDKLLFGTSSKFVYCLETQASGSPFLWRNNTEGYVDSSIALTEGIAIATSESGRVIAFANPDLAARVDWMTVSEDYPYEGETIEISGQVFNNGSMKLSGTANFYYYIIFNQGVPDKITISQHNFELDVDESLIINTNTKIFDRDWSEEDVFMTLIWLEIDNVSYPESEEKQKNNVDVERIWILEHYEDGWLSYQRDNYNTGNGPSGSITNKTMWKYDTGLLGVSNIHAPILYGKGRIFAGSTNKKLYSIIDNDGSYDWDTELDGRILGAPTLLMNRAGSKTYEKIFLGTESGTVYALTPNRGELNWSYQTGNKILGSPLISNGTVYIGTTAAEFFAFDEDGFNDGDQGVDDSNESKFNADKIWEITLPGSTRTNPVLAPEEDLIILVVDDTTTSTVMAIERETGATNWSYKFNSLIDGSPVYAKDDGYVYVGCNDRNMYALDIQGTWDGPQGWSGEADANNNNADIIWKYDVNSNIPASAALDIKNNYLVFGTTDGYIYALDAVSYSIIWKFYTGDQIMAAPTIADGKVYVGTTSGVLYCLKQFNQNINSTKTELLWKFDAQSPILVPPVVIQHATFVATEAGIIYKLGAPNVNPIARIDEPKFNQTYFIEEKIILDASSSYDPEDGKNLSYVWRIIPKNEPDNSKILYNTTKNSVVSTVLNLTVINSGVYTINLTVIDSYGAMAYNTTNISVLKSKIDIWPNDLIPAWCKIYYTDNGAIDLYQASDPKVGNLDDSGKSIGGIDVFLNQYYSVYGTNYKVKWFNVSIGLDYAQPPEGYNISRARVFKLESNQMVRCANTGFDKKENIVWANCSGNIITPRINQLFAPGTFDNTPPTIIIRDDVITPNNGTKNTKFKFFIEYVDSDDDLPIAANGGFVQIDINGDIYQMEENNMNDTNVKDGKFYTLTLDSNAFLRGVNELSFLAHDGTYLTKSKIYLGPNVTFGDNPIANPGSDLTVTAGEPFYLDGRQSSDPDGIIIKWLWDTDGDGDFNDSGGSKNGSYITWIFNELDTYTVTLYVEDDDGNFDKANITITVKPEVEDKKDKDEQFLSSQDMIIYGGLVGLIILIILIIVLLLYRNKLKEERERKEFMIEEGEEEELEGEGEFEEEEELGTDEEELEEGEEAEDKIEEEMVAAKKQRMKGKGKKGKMKGKAKRPRLPPKKEMEEEEPIEEGEGLEEAEETEEAEEDLELEELESELEEEPEEEMPEEEEIVEEEPEAEVPVSEEELEEELEGEEAIKPEEPETEPEEEREVPEQTKESTPEKKPVKSKKKLKLKGPVKAKSKKGPKKIKKVRK